MSPATIQQVRPRHLLLGHSRELRGIDSKIDEIRLLGKSFLANVTDAVTEATLTRTMEGASTLTITVDDSDGELRRSELLEQRIDVELDDLWFRFVGAQKQGPSLTLTFEDREIARLRNHRGAKKAYRDKVTRAEFVLMLIREVKHPPIPAWVPELHVEQPVESSRADRAETQVTLEGGARGDKGLDRGAKLTVKGERASSAQIELGDTALRVAAGLDAPSTAAMALIAALIAESEMQNLPGGLGSSSGALQLLSSTAAALHVNARDVEACCRLFLIKGFTGGGGAIELAKQGMEPAAIAAAVQGNAAGSASYSPWIGEAKKWVEAFHGAGARGTLQTTRTVEKRYAFERKANEDSWAAITRLAEEVHWRAFSSAGIVYYVAESALIDSKVQARISEDSPGVDVIDWDWDQGKKIQEATVEARARAWGAPPGSVVVLEKQGPASARYLVSQIESSLFDEAVTITLKRKTLALPEPAPETKDVSHSSRFQIAGDAGGSGSAMVRWAKRYVGTREGSTLQQRWADEFGYPASVPWCSIFIAAGIKAVTDLSIPSNPAYSGSWLKWKDGERVAKERRQAGDLLIFDWGDGGITDHIGLCVGHGQMISGNYGNKVSQSDDRAGAIVGVVRPDY